jgi:NADH-quinone oxidoreductase subunit J
MSDPVLVATAAGCAVALLSALGVVLLRRPVHGAVALLVHSLAIASLFLTMGADLPAMSQVIIYSGAVVVLFLFVVLLLPEGGVEQRPERRNFVAAILGGGALLSSLALFGLSALPTLNSGSGRFEGTPASVADVGRALFGTQLVPFELTTVLLLVAIVGAVAIWRRQREES